MEICWHGSQRDSVASKYGICSKGMPTLYEAGVPGVPMNTVYYKEGSRQWSQLAWGVLRRAGADIVGSSTAASLCSIFNLGMPPRPIQI